MASFTPYDGTYSRADWRENPTAEEEEISPECRALLIALDVPVEILDFDYGEELH